MNSDIELARKSFVHQLRTTELPQCRQYLSTSINGKIVNACAMGVYVHEIANDVELRSSMNSYLVELTDNVVEAERLFDQITEWNDHNCFSFDEIADKLEEKWNL
jgi:hypothetical protein